MSDVSPLVGFQKVSLPPVETWPASVHLLDERVLLALKAAEACSRPLLIRGEPGVGKSQTARAAAALGKRPFVSAVIDGRTHAHDLMWRLDAVRRLGDAQVLRQGERLPSEQHYVEPQALWWAVNWTAAQAQLQLYCQQAASVACGAVNQAEVDSQVTALINKRIPQVPKDYQWTPERGPSPVLLLDEIDKADPDLPNALLEVLANGGFRLPFAGELVTTAKGQRPPLVVITTNEERELPPAFLRRCWVLTLELPQNESEFLARMTTLGQQHQQLWQGRCEVLEEAASDLWKQRQAVQSCGDYLPGTAEYLDTVSALANLWPDQKETQFKQLQELQKFTFQKTL